MTRTFTNDKDEISYLRRKLNDTQNEINELKKQFGTSLSGIDFKGFSDRQQALIEYIRKRPGNSKEDAIRELTSSNQGSRVTIMKDIDLLTNEFHIILARKDKPNSMIYKLYINSESELLLLYEDLNKIKTLFFGLIEKIKNDPLKYNSKGKFNGPLERSIVLIYVHVLGIYIIFSILKWSKEIEDTTTLNKLYSLLFFNLLNIQKEISTSFKINVSIPFKHATVGDIFSPLYRNLTHRFFILDQPQIIEILKEFNKYENLNEIHDLLRLVWKISFPIYRYHDLDTIVISPSPIDEFEDLEKALKYYEDNHVKIDNHKRKIQRLLKTSDNKK